MLCSIPRNTSALAIGALLGLLPFSRCCAEAQPACAVPTKVDIPVPGFTALRLQKVILCRYAEGAGQYIGEFRAQREVLSGQYIESTITLHVMVKLRDGQTVRFDAPQTPGSDNWFVVYSRDLYKPDEIASYQITADTSWAAQEAEERREAKAADRRKAARIAAEAHEKEEAARKAEERERLKAACSSVYKQTADKKVGDLTVKESKQVQACSELGMYPPG